MTRCGTSVRDSMVLWVEQVERVEQVEQVLCCEQIIHGYVEVGVGWGKKESRRDEKVLDSTRSTHRVQPAVQGATNESTVRVQYILTIGKTRGWRNKGPVVFNTAPEVPHPIFWPADKASPRARIPLPLRRPVGSARLAPSIVRDKLSTDSFHVHNHVQ